MSQMSFEQVVNAVRSLPPDELAKLRRILDAPDEKAQPEADEKQRRQEAAHAAARAASLRDFTADRKWLVEHRSEYAGQWVALWYGQLLHHSPNAKDVFAAADASGHSDALVVYVEPPYDYPIINLG